MEQQICSSTLIYRIGRKNWSYFPTASGSLQQAGRWIWVDLEIFKFSTGWKLFGLLFCLIPLQYYYSVRTAFQSAFANKAYFNSFTTVDSIWCLGVITHLEINLSICYNVLLRMLPSSALVVERSCLYGLVTRITQSFTDYCAFVTQLHWKNFVIETCWYNE